VKIVYLNPTGQLGGAERSLLDFIASVRAAEPRCSLTVLAAGNGAMLDEARALGARTQVLPMPRALAALGDAGAGGPAGGGQARLLGMLGQMSLVMPSVAVYAARLRRVIRAADPDLIHTNGFKMHVLGAWTAPHSVPVLWHVHDYVSARPLMAPLLRAHVERCTAVVANSLSVAADVRVALGPHLKIFPIYNAVDLKRFTPVGPSLDLDELAKLSPPVGPVVRIGLIATMARWKGHEVFLRALKLLADKPRVRGYVIGDALYQTQGSQYKIAELRCMAQRLGIDGRVGFTGFVNDAPAAMRALDVVVHASVQPEPFGLAIAEAMACGRAVMVSHAGGAAEIVTPGEDAFVHEPGNVESLAAGLRELVLDPELRARLGRGAALAARRRFARARLSAELLPVYRMLTARAA
jgi:glycosyltransferase involved in cell wall biosynthesis